VPEQTFPDSGTRHVPDAAVPAGVNVPPSSKRSVPAVASIVNWSLLIHQVDPSPIEPETVAVPHV